MHVKDMRDIVGGGLLIVLGSAAAVAAYGYGIGDASNIEPGFFPLILSCLIALTGLLIVLLTIDFSGTAEQAPPMRFVGWNLWCLLVIAVGFALFGFFLPMLGLFATCMISITVVGIGSRLLSPIAALTTSAVLSFAAVVLFRYLLDLQVPAWPWGG